MRKRYDRRKQKRTVLIVIGICLFVVITLLVFNAYETYKESQYEYGTIGDINVDQEDLMTDESEKQSQNRPEMTCMIVDCGDAQAVLFDLGTVEVLYDCGYAEDGKKIAKKVDSYIDGELDYLILSHSHVDHVGGAPAITDKFDVGMVITSGETKGDSTQFDSAMEAIKKEKCEIKEDADMSFELGDGCVLSIHENMDPGDTEEPNDLSVIATVKYGEDLILLTGDSEGPAEKLLKGKFSDVTLYVAGHHMSSSSSNLVLLNEWDSDYIVGSCAGKKKSEYGFPHDETIKRCKTVTDNIYATYKSGDIIFTTNGAENSISCKDEDKLTINEAM